MKKVILIAVMATGMAMTLDAQHVQPEMKRDQSADERVNKSGDRAEKDLGLTAEQKTKWEAAALERKNANAPLREKMNGATTPEERTEIRKQLRANNEKFDTTVSAFLTADQKAKYDSMKQKRKDKMHHKEHDRKEQN